MSPLSLRRYRAERLLRDEFEGLRARVIAAVRARLRGSGVSLDADDLEACYAQAWQGLYAAVLEGREIENPTGWLTLVTFRRASVCKGKRKGRDSRSFLGFRPSPFPIRGGLSTVFGQRNALAA